MRILVIGSSGFIGKEVMKALTVNHDVYGGDRSGNKLGRNRFIDLTKKDTIAAILKTVHPQVIINCAGVVDKSEKAKLNPLFTSNLLEEVVSSRLELERIIISGSAAEYGLVDEKNIPVDENTPLRASSEYGLSKLQESQLALNFRAKHGLPIVVARIFNPIGIGMNPQLLIPRLVQQIKEIQTGARQSIEVSRLDTKRDYLGIRDVALAIKSLAENRPKEPVYNIGSGESTSNQELIDLMLKSSKLEARPRVVETSVMPEPMVAIAADIKRINKELHWKPKKTLEGTIKEIMHASHKH